MHVIIINILYSLAVRWYINTVLKLFNFFLIEELNLQLKNY